MPLFFRKTPFFRKIPAYLFCFVFFLYLFVCPCHAAPQSFGPNGLKGLNNQQIEGLSKGKIIFSTTDSCDDMDDDDDLDDDDDPDSALIEAAMVFDSTPEKTWALISKTGDQGLYLNEIKKISTVKQQKDRNLQRFTLKVAFMTIKYQVIHHFNPDKALIYWGLDPDYDNELDDLRGFWRFYPYEGGKTLARYGSNVSIPNVPSWIEAMFKKNGVKKSLEAVKKYVNSGGTYRK